MNNFRIPPDIIWPHLAANYTWAEAAAPQIHWPLAPVALRTSTGTLPTLSAIPHLQMALLMMPTPWMEARRDTPEFCQGWLPRVRLALMGWLSSVAEEISRPQPAALTPRYQPATNHERQARVRGVKRDRMDLWIAVAHLIRAALERLAAGSSAEKPWSLSCSIDLILWRDIIVETLNHLNIFIRYLFIFNKIYRSVVVD